MAEIYSIPDNNGSNGIPLSIPVGGFGGNGFGFGNGNGQTNLMDLLGFAIVASIFPNMFGGGFGFGGNRGMGMGSGAAGFLSNQINNDSGRELIMQAVTNQGEASRTAIATLSSMLGQDFNLVNASIQGIQNALNTIGANQGMNALQVINAIQGGNASLASQFQQCCCQNQLAMANQTNALTAQAERNNNAVLQAINAQTVAMNDQFCAARERDMQSKIETQAEIITQLRGQIDNANQTAQITGYVNSLIAPLQAKVTEIADKQPQTVPVQWPQLTAVNTTPFMSGGFYPGYNGFGGNVVF